MGLPQPLSQGLAFDGSLRARSSSTATTEDGSKFQGVRLISPVEEGDYGWRLRPGGSARPRRLRPGGRRRRAARQAAGAVARLGRGSRRRAGRLQRHRPSRSRSEGPSIEPDLARRAVRGFKVEPKGALARLEGRADPDDVRRRPVPPDPGRRRCRRGALRPRPSRASTPTARPGAKARPAGSTGSPGKATAPRPPRRPGPTTGSGSSRRPTISSSSST